MPDVPTCVTRDQMKAVCELLGLPATEVVRVEMDAHDGLAVQLRVRDGSGRIPADSRAEPLIATLILPIVEVPTARRTKNCDLSPELGDALGDYFDFAQWARVERSEAESILRQHCPVGSVLTIDDVTKAGDRLATLSARRDVENLRRKASL